jgi:hypothetical protein
MLLISSALSVFLIGISVVAAIRARDPSRTYWSCWFGIVLAVIPCFLLFPVYFYHALVMGVFATVCSATHARRSVFLTGAIAIPIAVYAIVVLPVWRQVQAAARLYQPESLESRLAYENQFYLMAGRQLPPSSINDEHRWRVEWEAPYEAQTRFYALKMLHDDSTQLFVEGAGFGVGRMRRVSPSALDLADPIRLAEPVSLPEPPIAGHAPPITAEDSILAERSAEGDKNLDTLLEQSRADFLNPLGFGYVKSRGDAIGFLSHRFTKSPIYTIPATGIWRIDSLDLISMLKHKEPVAYVSKNLPRMDELRDAPTRPLDDFERERLPKLQAGEEISAAQGARRLRVLGALRATESCLTCHTAVKNDLLGAFSYDLRLDMPAK